MKRILLMAALSLLPLAGSAQQILSLEDCRRMAIEGNKDLEQARTKPGSDQARDQCQETGYRRLRGFYDGRECHHCQCDIRHIVQK